MCTLHILPFNNVDRIKIKKLLDQAMTDLILRKCNININKISFLNLIKDEFYTIFLFVMIKFNQIKLLLI